MLYQLLNMWRFSLTLVILSFAFGQPLRISPASAPNLTGKFFAPGTMIIVTLAEPIDGPDSIRLDLRPKSSSAASPLPVVAFDGRVWAMVPEDAPLGPATIILTTRGGSEGSDVLIQRSAVGVFTENFRGTGQALAQVTKAESGLVNLALARPARPGEVVTLWLTGLGQVAAEDVEVELAGKSIAPTFAGHAPGQPGLDQISFVVPVEAASGCYVPVRIRVGNMVSDPVTIPTTHADGHCSHPLALSAEQLQTLDQGGAVMVGSLHMSASAADPVRESPGEASVVLRFEWRDNSTLGSPLLPDRLTSCSWVRMDDSGGSLISVPNTSRDAGQSVALRGPFAESIVMHAHDEGYYYLDSYMSPSLSFSPGVWTLSVPGGAGIRAFQASMTLPGPIRLLHPDPLSDIPRDADLVVEWASDDLSNSDAVSVFLQTYEFESPPFGSKALGIRCSAQARDGRLVVPREMLALLPETPRGTIQLIAEPNRNNPIVAVASPVLGGALPVVMGYRLSQWLHLPIE